MKILTYLTDNLYYHQKKLEGFAIFLLCLIIAFQFENFKLTWLWNDKILIAIVLVLIIILTSLIWVRIERKRTNELIEQIKTETLSNKPQLENPTTELSVRQSQVNCSSLKLKATVNIPNIIVKDINKFLRFIF